MRTIFTLLACLALAPLASGCHGTASDYCDLACDCEGCSDNQYDECIIKYESGMDTADAYGCSDDWDRAHSCVLTNHDCIADKFTPELSCLDELADVSACIKDNSAIY